MLVFTLLFFRGGKKLPQHIAGRAITQIHSTKTLDPAHAVLEAHKIFTFALASLVNEKQRKRIKAADVIKKFADKFPNSKHVWKSHRLRNRIAHEPDVNVTQTHADLVRRDFVRAINAISQ